MTTQNARDRFKDAITILVDEKGDIKQRLTIAYISQLSRIAPERELPGHLVSTFDGIKFLLETDEVAGDRGTVSKEIKKITEDEASRIARQIIEMFLEVHWDRATAETR